MVSYTVYDPSWNFKINYPNSILLNITSIYPIILFSRSASVLSGAVILFQSMFFVMPLRKTTTQNQNSALVCPEIKYSCSLFALPHFHSPFPTLMLPVCHTSFIHIWSKEEILNKLWDSNLFSSRRLEGSSRNLCFFRLHLLDQLIFEPITSLLCTKNKLFEVHSIIFQLGNRKSLLWQC